MTPDDQERVAEPAGEAGGRGRRPGADGAGGDGDEDGDAERAADLVAGRVQAGQHPRLVVGGAGEHGQRHRDQRDAESQARDEHARQDIANVAAVAVDTGQQQHPGGGQRERDGHGNPQAGVTDEVAAEMRAEADDGGHRQEREPGLQRAGAEDLLQVDRGEQERAEQDRGRGEHHHEAAADSALAEPRDVEQGPAGVQLQCGERGEAGQAGEAEAERLHGRPAGIGGLRDGVDERRQAGSGDHGAAEIEAAPLGSSDVGGHDLHRCDGDADADGQVDEEDGSPVDELSERPAQQDADGGAGAADGTPDAERLRAVGALEGGRDDRQRGRGQHRCPQTLSGAGGEEDSSLVASAEASDATVKTPRPVRKTRRRPSRSAARPPSSRRLPKTSE